jgi:signal transduction histidine kinase
MSHLALVSPKLPAVPSPASQWAHDIRNALATVGLHLDTLERLAGPAGQTAVEAAHALMLRATAMCEQGLAHTQRGEAAPRRRAVEAFAAIRQVAKLIAPSAPAEFSIRVRADGPVLVTADADQLFRILFNLLHNAASVGRRGQLKTVDISIERAAASVVLRIADDGPGLPASVRKQLFRAGVPSSGGNGLGLSIARELAERNGGTLRLAPSARGAAFLLELPAAAAAAQESAVTRSLGRRAA